MTQRTGLLVLRVWLDDTEQDGLRARITETLDVSTSERVETAAAGEEEIVEAVGGWLRSFVDSSAAQPRDRSA